MISEAALAKAQVREWLEAFTAFRQSEPRVDLFEVADWLLNTARSKRAKNPPAILLSMPLPPVGLAREFHRMLGLPDTPVPLAPDSSSVSVSVTEQAFHATPEGALEESAGISEAEGPDDAESLRAFVQKEIQAARERIAARKEGSHE